MVEEVVLIEELLLIQTCKLNADLKAFFSSLSFKIKILDAKHFQIIQNGTRIWLSEKEDGQIGVYGLALCSVEA